MHSGYLALLLHAHLPFVRHPEHEDFLEEDWLYEAIQETYVPLLKMLRQMAAEEMPVRLTFTMTPPLCAMLRDPLLQDRAVRYLHRGIELAASEKERPGANDQERELAAFYEKRFRDALHFYDREIERDIVGAFAQLQAEGLVEIITCAATHGFLPLMESCPEAMRAQVMIGRDYHIDCFGSPPSGIWLPECAYVAGVEGLLQDANLRWFVIDAHGLMYGQPRPRFAIYAPCYTPTGPAAFARDRDSSRQVWSAREGYPGDPAYRDFYSDVGQERELEYLQKFFGQEFQRRNTGLKYRRITSPGPEKELYRRDWAMGAADAHATDFLQARIAQVQHLRPMMGPYPPIILSPFDAELFGHWWFEGPEFLNFFLRKAVHDQEEFRLISPTEFLNAHPTAQIVRPSASSWGNKGYWEVWLDRSNSWIYPHLHAAARRMTEDARRLQKQPTPFQERMLRQMARELLLAQSSDWAFLMKVGTAKEYAEKRTRDHLLRFNRLHEELGSGVKESSILDSCEQRDNLFPDLNWRYYL